MRYHKPSRVLNDRSVFMGLDYIDLAALGFVLLVLQLSLKPWRLEFYAFFFTSLFALMLSPIRLRFRRKIIRDSLLFVFGPKRIKR